MFCFSCCLVGRLVFSLGVSVVDACFCLFGLVWFLVCFVFVFVSVHYVQVL